MRTLLNLIELLSEDIYSIYYMYMARDLRETRIYIINTALEEQK